MVRSCISVKYVRVSEKMRGLLIFKVINFPLELMGNESEIREYLDI